MTVHNSVITTHIQFHLDESMTTQVGVWVQGMFSVQVGESKNSVKSNWRVQGLHQVQVCESEDCIKSNWPSPRAASRPTGRRCGRTGFNSALTLGTSTRNAPTGPCASQNGISLWPRSASRLRLEIYLLYCVSLNNSAKLNYLLCITIHFHVGSPKSRNKSTYKDSSYFL